MSVIVAVYAFLPTDAKPLGHGRRRIGNEALRRPLEAANSSCERDQRRLSKPFLAAPAPSGLAYRGQRQHTQGADLIVSEPGLYATPMSS